MTQIQGGSRKLIALVVLAGLALLAWQTLEPGRIRWLVWVLLGGFGLRILLTPVPRKDADEQQDGFEE